MTEEIQGEVLEEGGNTEHKKLPNMNEFSPGTLDTNQVHEVLVALHPYEGDKNGMLGVLEAFSKIAATADPRQRKARANNVLIGMSQCGLLAATESGFTEFTEIANEILAAGASHAAIIFAKHLLINAHGLELLDAVEMIKQRREDLTIQAIREELRSRGYQVTENEGNASKIRLWLEGAGICDQHWSINDSAFNSTIGASVKTLSIWNGLTPAQRVFSKAAKGFNDTSPGSWISVRDIKKVCETTHTRRVFPEGRLRDAVIRPLCDTGLIEAQGMGAGRGGDSGQVRVTGLLSGLKVELPSEGMSGIPADLRARLSTPLEQIFEELESTDKNIKGLALELLALRIVRDIGLFPVCFRERTNKTQQAEVDLVANGVHLHYSRWLVQCKNTASVEVSDIAKEVGMGVVLKAHVILMVTTGTFRKTVKHYANGLASTSSFQALLIDKSVLAAYRKNGPSAVIDWLQGQAHSVLSLKTSQLQDVE